MKYIVIFIIGFTLFGACKKELNPSSQIITNVYFPGDMLFGNASAIKIDTDWKASAAAYYIESDSLIRLDFVTYSEEGFLREVISIGLIPSKVGIYSIKNIPSDSTTLNSSYSIAIDGGDIPGSNYSVDETIPDNELIITNFDSLQNTFEGTFNLSFLKNPVNFADIPDHFEKVTFSNGRFEVQILE